MQAAAPIINDQSFDIYENSPNTTKIGDIISSDSSNITYTILSGNTNSTFAVNSTTGELTVNNNSILVNTSNPIFTLGVQVASSLFPALTDTAVITINVLKVYTICSTNVPHFSSYSTNLIGLLTVGNVILNTGTITDYAIEWRVGSTTGSTVLLSGIGSDPLLQSLHPLNSEPIEGGVLYPVIRYINVNGVLYTSYPYSSYGLYSPDLKTCLNTITVKLMNCSNGASSGDYPHQITYTNSTQPSSVANRSLRFDLNNDGTSSQLAWQFIGNTIADRLVVTYVSSVIETTISDWVIGQDCTSTNYYTTPKFYDYIFLKQLIELSGFTYTTGDYIRFDVSPSYNAPGNTDTNWSLNIKCFTSTTPFNCDFAPNTVNDVITGATMVMARNSTTCNNELTFNTGSAPYVYLGLSDLYRYLNIGVGYSFDWGIPQKISLANQINGNLTWGKYYGGEVFLNGVMTISKTGTTVVYSFTDNTDYLLYKNGYLTTTGTTHWIVYTSDDTLMTHYKVGYTNQKISMSSGDTFTTTTDYFSHDDVFTFNDTSHTITIVLTTQTNNLSNVACDTTYNNVNAWLSNVNNYIIGATFSNTTIYGVQYPFGYLYTQSYANSITTQEWAPYISVDRHLIDNICTLTPDWNLVGNMWYFYKYRLRVTIGDINDAANHYAVYNGLLPDGSVDTVWTLIQSVG